LQLKKSFSWLRFSDNSEKRWYERPIKKEEISEIQLKVEAAIKKLIRKDAHLLDKNLNERCITHKLAIYLSNHFKGYHVDCEYNGNVYSPDGRKSVFLTSPRIYAEKNSGSIDENLTEELTARFIYPDIIVHERGELARNLCVIEVKKSQSKVNEDYDIKKLKNFTDSSLEKGLQYDVGFFVVLSTGDDFNKNKDNFSMKIFVDGKQQ